MNDIMRDNIGRFADMYYTSNGRTILARGVIVDLEDNVLHLTSDTWGDYYLDLRSVSVFTVRFCEPEEADRFLGMRPDRGIEYETKTTV